MADNKLAQFLMNLCDTEFKASWEGDRAAGKKPKDIKAYEGLSAKEITLIEDAANSRAAFQDLAKAAAGGYSPEGVIFILDKPVQLRAEKPATPTKKAKAAKKR